MKILLMLSVIHFILHDVKPNSRITCKNQQNEMVDWFIVYKSPDIDRNQNELVRDGKAFFYMDPSTNGQWILSSAGIDSDNQLLAYTLQQIYKALSDENKFYAMYNDDWPENNRKAPKSLGHCKGDMMFDNSTGFWLIHSVPKFPRSEQYSYPTSGFKFGQTALCITFPFDQLPKIANQLAYYQPAIYLSFLPTTFASEIPELSNVLRRKGTVRDPFNQVTELVSLDGAVFRNFAKHKKWNKELYVDLVAPNLQSALFSETWQNGNGDLPSNCTVVYSVNNIDIVKLDSKVRFRDTSDHSKWAITADSKYTCIGDINRQRGQLKRSGGTMCFKDETVWHTFHDSIDKIEDCPVRTLSLDPGVGG